MKSKFYLLGLLAFALVACDQQNNKPEPEPEPEKVTELEIVNDQILVSADGGAYEVKYSVVNPVEGGKISVSTIVDWISDVDYATEGKVTFEAALNEGEQRTEEMIITYTGTDVNVEKTVTIVQSASEAQVHFHAEYISGGFIKDNYYGLFISDVGMDEYGQYIPNGRYYRLDLNDQTHPEDWTAITVPEGVYNVTDMLQAACYQINADVTDYTEYLKLVDGELTVTHEGENLVVVGLLVDENGNVHRLDYNGPCNLELYSKEGIGLVQHDVKPAETHLSNAKYVADNGEVMLITMQLSEVVEDYSGPFSMLYIDLYAPYDDYELKPGTYEVGTSEDMYTVYPGYVDPSNLHLFATYAVASNGSVVNAALASEGTITVTKDEATGNYTFDCKLFTAEGFAIEYYYEGEFDIPNIPGVCFSTLTEDYTVDMSEITGFFGVYWGDEYETGGGYYKIELVGPFEQDPDTWMTSGTGESVYLEVIANTLEYEDGIPTGIYTPCADRENPQPGEYLTGYQSVIGGNTYQGTRYVGGYYEGFINRVAPAVTGELDVTNHGDGTYTFKFAFQDDRGNTWDGNWTGGGTMLDFSSFAASAEAQATPSVPFRAEENQTIEVKKFHGLF